MKVTLIPEGAGQDSQFWESCIVWTLKNGWLYSTKEKNECVCQCCVSVLEKVIESLVSVHDVLFCFVLLFSVCMMEQSEFDKKYGNLKIHSIFKNSWVVS